MGNWRWRDVVGWTGRGSGLEEKRGLLLNWAGEFEATERPKVAEEERSSRSEGMWGGRLGESCGCVAEEVLGSELGARPTVRGNVTDGVNAFCGVSVPRRLSPVPHWDW